MTRVAVLGAGSWGTTLADLLARKAVDVRLWAYEADVVASVNAAHENRLFLPGAQLAPSLRAVGDAAEAVDGADVVLSVAPSHATRAVLTRARDGLRDGAIVVSATKGLETETLASMSRVAADVVPDAPFCVLSGPSFAQEVYAGQPTAVVAAAADEAVAHSVQQLFSTPRFRVYRHSDVLGVELAGALKNVMAVAAGMLEGLGLGDNPRAALLTRGLAEITRLGVALGAEPLTFMGLAGMGDLILTCCGQLSRNRALGVALAQGTTLEAYRATHRTVAEGANASRAAAALGERAGVELPITRKVCEILFSGAPAAESVRELMARELKAEQWR